MPRSSRETAQGTLLQGPGTGGLFHRQASQGGGLRLSPPGLSRFHGPLERVEHGLYRLASLPPGEHDDLVRLTLWSRNRQDEPQAVVSHESALVLHDLSELLPAEIHLTAPPTFRKDPPAGCVLHKARLLPKAIEERAGFRVTVPAADPPRRGGERRA